MPTNTGKVLLGAVLPSPFTGGRWASLTGILEKSYWEQSCPPSLGGRRVLWALSALVNLRVGVLHVV